MNPPGYHSPEPKNKTVSPFLILYGDYEEVCLVNKFSVFSGVHTTTTKKSSQATNMKSKAATFSLSPVTIWPAGWERRVSTNSVRVRIHILRRFVSLETLCG